MLNVQIDYTLIYKSSIGLKRICTLKNLFILFILSLNYTNKHMVDRIG
jgi:hypothetical protein